MKSKRVAAGGVFVPVGLTCEYRVNPLGLDVPAPRLSWRYEAPGRGARQTAWQVLVASSEAALAAGRGDLWNSGRIRSDASVLVPYDGKRLRSRQRCFWKVRAWDAKGRSGPYSAPSVWEMGLLRESDWKAQWIAPAAQAGPALPEPAPAPMLRREFRLDRGVTRARAYVCGLGYHELYVNGRRIGRDVLEPAFTRYDRRVLYVTCDVTAALRKGDNAVGVILGTGWYNAHTPGPWQLEHAAWRDRPKLLVQLEADLDDGSRRTIAGDPRWKTGTGPVVFDGLRNGETYDARLEKPGWARPGYDDAAWAAAMPIAGPGGRLAAQQHTPMRVVRTIRPRKVWRVGEKAWVFDLGRSIAGWTQLRARGPAGTEVTLRHAEKLTDKGDIDAGNIGPFIGNGRVQTDVYVLKGKGTEAWEPRFTYHGYRYVRVEGLPGKPTLDTVRGREMHTDLAARGTFACSNRLVNRIQECALASTVGNFHGMPTDCPHREKLGWTGDASLSAEQTLLNFDPMTVYAKWMDDFEDALRPSGQLPGIVPTGGWGYNWGSGPAWDAAFTHIPWYQYVYCGDTRILADHYAGMKRQVAFMTSMADGHIVDFGLGDWCPPGGFGHVTCPVAVTSTGYYYANARILSDVATVLGKRADAGKYARLAARIRKAFLARFYDSETGAVAGGSQTAQACALYMGLLPETERARALEALVAAVEAKGGHLDFGILGAKYVMNTLTDCGRADVAWTIATKEGFPGWAHWIRQGATTLWESWDGNASRIHHMFSDISAWFYKTLAGLEPDMHVPGFKRFTVRPRPVSGLTWVRAAHESMYGPIRVAWKRRARNFTLDVTVPPNTAATVFVPADDPASVTEGGKPLGRAAGVEPAGEATGCAVVATVSGTYRFASVLAGARGR